MKLEEFRRAKDDFFRQPDSPLMLDQRAGFTGLKYYPENSALRFALPLDSNVSSEIVTMQITAVGGTPLGAVASTGGTRRYVRAGKIHFLVAGQPAELTVFKDEHGFFMPFRDATAETETYGAGRYLEPEMTGDTLRVDFNEAYNPYCAYNTEYACPIPPRENWVKVPIQAGEKKFHD